MSPDEVLEEALTAAAEILSESDSEDTGDFLYGGSIWTFDPESPHGPWNVYRNHFGLHPSRVNSTDLDRIERCRQCAESLVNAFPHTLEHLQRVGAHHAEKVLTHPIRSTEDASVWAASIWNAALPSRQPSGVNVYHDLSTFVAFHHDLQGDLIVEPSDDRTTVIVFWAADGSEYRPGQVLGQRHPVTLAAYGRGRSKK